MKTEHTQLKSTINDIEHLIDISDRLRSAWFWTDNGNASIRRWKEKNYQASAEWEEGGHTYKASIWTSFSRQNVYVYLLYV